MDAVRSNAAPGPAPSAGWLDGDPAPVVMQPGARHRPELQQETLPADAAECTGDCRNFPEAPATSGNTEQPRWHTALVRANEIRLAQAALKKDIVNGTLPLEALVLGAADVEAIQNARVFDVLQWKPRIGYSRARRITAGIVSETLTFAKIGDVTRERLALSIVDALEGGRS